MSTTTNMSGRGHSDSEKTASRQKTFTWAALLMIAYAIGGIFWDQELRVDEAAFFMQLRLVYALAALTVLITILLIKEHADLGGLVLLSLLVAMYSYFLLEVKADKLSPYFIQLTIVLLACSGVFRWKWWQAPLPILIAFLLYVLIPADRPAVQRVMNEGGGAFLVAAFLALLVNRRAYHLRNALFQRENALIEQQQELESHEQEKQTLLQEK